MTQEVVLFKALNGEEIIARLIEEDENQILIEKPRLLVAQPIKATGQMQISLVPWYLGSPDGTIEVRQEHIFSRLKHVPAELEKGYMQQTSSIITGTG